MLAVLGGIVIGVVIGFMYCIKENEKINKDYVMLKLITEKQKKKLIK